MLCGGPDMGRAAMDAVRALDPSDREILVQELGNLAGIAARRVGQDMAQALFGWMG